MKDQDNIDSAENVDPSTNLYIVLGRYMMVWQHVESMLCTIFVRILGGNSTTIRRVYYSSPSWEGRKRMLDAAINSPTMNLEETGSTFLKLIKTKIGQYQSVRNSIAHDQIVSFPDGMMGPDGLHPNAGTQVLIHGKFDRYIGDKEEISKTTTIGQLNQAHINASALLMILMLYLSTSDTDDDAYCRRLVGILKQLPDNPKTGTIPRKTHQGLIALHEEKKPKIVMS